LSNNLNKVLLIGPGNIGLDYFKVLENFNFEVDVIGRSKKSSDNFSRKAECFVHSGGLDSYVNNNEQPPKYAIVAVNENQLCEVTLSLMDYGVKNILLEKPGAISYNELLAIRNKSIINSSHVYIAYNRRFYQSVGKCRQLIKNQKPINVHFEFTEWSHDIDFEHYTNEELKRFFLCNSSHVVDLVFHLFGKPTILNTQTLGSLDWHPSASVFNGSGKTENDTLFTYHANWSSAGRWGVEIMLDDFKLILRPLEKLFIQHKGSLDTTEVQLSNTLDTIYKPGLFNEVNSFLQHSVKNLCTIDEQLRNFDYYYEIANYTREKI